MLGEVENCMFRGGAAILAHGILGLRMYPCPHKVNHVMYACIHEL
jgi:uncharacterized protein (DUF1810 family)